jgi:hypothetical protein
MDILHILLVAALLSACFILTIKADDAELNSAIERDYPISKPPDFDPITIDRLQNTLLKAADEYYKEKPAGCVSSASEPIRLYLSCYEISRDKKYLKYAYEALTKIWENCRSEDTELLYNINAVNGKIANKNFVITFKYAWYIWLLSWYLQLDQNKEIAKILDTFGDAVWKHCFPDQNGLVGSLYPENGKIKKKKTHDYYIDWMIWGWVEAFAATGDEKYLQRAKALTAFFWNLRNPDTDILPGDVMFNQISYKVSNSSIAHQGFFVGSMFRAALLTGDDYFIKLGVKAGNAIEKYFWDEKLGRYVNWCSTKGKKLLMFSIGIEQLDGFLLYAAYVNKKNINEHIYRHFQFIWTRIWSEKNKTFFTLRTKGNPKELVMPTKKSVSRHPAAFMANTSYFLGDRIFEKWGNISYSKAYCSYMKWYLTNHKKLTDDSWFGIYNDWVKSVAFLKKPRIVASDIACSGIHRIWEKNKYTVSFNVKNYSNVNKKGRLILYLNKLPESKKYKYKGCKLISLRKCDKNMQRHEIEIKIKPENSKHISIESK